MALDFRFPADFAFGTLTSAISVSDTTLSSADFSAIRVLSSGASHVPIVLLDPTTKVYETVWLTVHSSGATSATVTRGKEGTVALEWPAGTQWICSPTTRDIVSANSLAGLPSDAHVGMRVAVSDKGETWAKTLNQGWLGELRGNREDTARCIDGTAQAANGFVPIFKALTHAGTTNGSGILAVTLPNGGFPNRIITASLTRASGTWFMPVIEAGSTTRTTLGIICQTGVGTVLASAGVTIGIIAIGY